MDSAFKSAAGPKTFKRHRSFCCCFNFLLLAYCFVFASCLFTDSSKMQKERCCSKPLVPNFGPLPSLRKSRVLAPPSKKASVSLSGQEKVQGECHNMDAGGQPPFQTAALGLVRYAPCTSASCLLEWRQGCCEGLIPIKDSEGVLRMTCLYTREHGRSRYA